MLTVLPTIFLPLSFVIFDSVKSSRKHKENNDIDDEDGEFQDEDVSNYENTNDIDDQDYINEDLDDEMETPHDVHDANPSKIHIILSNN